MHRSTLALLLLTGLVSIALGVHSVPAQQPTSEQRNAIRAACRSDFIANCAGVEPGGKEALECLLRSHDGLSASCKTAVDAVAAKLQPPAPPAAAASPPAAAPSSAEGPSQTAAPPSAAPPAPTVSQEELNAARGACTLNDIAAHCSWIAPSSPEIVLCLRANVAGLSSACRAAVSGSAAPPNAAAEPTPAAAPAAPPVRQNSREVPPPRAATNATTAASGGAPGKPTAAQTAAIRSACRSDFMANCSGVQPGGPAALQCLQGNATKLSQACRTAIAAVGGAPSGATPSPATAEAPTAAPLRPRGFIPLPNRLVVLRICRTDVVALCGGTPPGGGQIIDCLAANARSLSPDCYAAVARVSR
jgi:hypothetical protein